MGRAFTHLGDEPVVDGWRIRLVKARFEAPDGTRFERDVVRHPGAVAVVPVTDDGNVLLVRQYRGPIDTELLEIPAGTRDVEGEAPEVTAARELAEEVGVRARDLRLLVTMLNSPGFCDERTWLYLATGLEVCSGERAGIEEQHMEIVELPLAAVDDLVATGVLCDGQTVLGLLMARDVLGLGTTPGR